MREKKEFTKRKIYQQAVTMRYILQGYSSFFCMMKEREAAMCVTTYEDAERTCFLANFLTRAETVPADFLGKEDEHVNKAIEYYKELKTFFASCDSFIKNTLLAFYNHIYHSFISVHFFMGGYLLYPSFLLAFQCYVESGYKHYQDFKACVCEFDIRNHTTKPVDTRFFRMDMIKLYGIYDEVWGKRERRREKWLQTRIY